MLLLFLLVCLPGIFTVEYDEFHLKKEIIITNPNAFPTPVPSHVLLEFDSETLINEDKLQTYCGDIRFRTESRDPVAYWLESGCFTKRTMVWVRIDEIIPPDSSLSIWMHYHHPYALDAGLPYWDPLFIFRDSSCDGEGGWFDVNTDQFSDLLSTTRFIKPDHLTWGNRVGIDSHSHTASSFTSSSPRIPKTTTSFRVHSSLLSHGINENHIHSSSSQSTYGEPALPPYINLGMCFAYGGFSTFPARSAAFFTETPTSPAGGVKGNWVEYPEVTQTERFVRVVAMEEANMTGGSLGPHLHGMSNFLLFEANDETPCEYSGSSTTDNSDDAHSHYFSGFQTYEAPWGGEVMPDYRYAVLGYAMSNVTSVEEGIVLFAENKPPLGWEIATEFTGDGRLLRVGTQSKSGQTGNADSHDHIFGGRYSDLGGQYRSSDCLTGGTTFDGILEHEHWIGNFTTSPSSISPATFTMIPYKRMGSLPVTYGDEIEAIWTCFDIGNWDQKVCNHGLGDCIGTDDCECSDEWYGEECTEMIESAVYAFENVMRIRYVAKLDIVKRSLWVADVYDFNCSLAIVEMGMETTGERTDADTVNGTNATSPDSPVAFPVDMYCSWEIESLYSSSFLVHHAPAGLDYLIARSVTDADSQVRLQIPVFVPPPFNWLFVYVGIFVPVGICVFCIICVVVVILIGLYARFGKTAGVQNRRIKEIEALDDIDVLIQERRLERESGSSLAHLKINRKMFHIDFEDVRLLAEVAEGSNGTKVYKCDWKGKEVAAKVFNMRTYGDGQAFCDEFEKEATILASVNHPFILKFYGATLAQPRIGFVLEFCQNGDIEQFLTSYVEENGGMYPLEQKIRLMGEIASAMSYLHSLGVVHRDLKGQNVLVTSSEEARVMDFGLSKMVDKVLTSSQMTRGVGTSIYMAPEVLLGQAYDTKCDVFSFAIMCFEMATNNFEPYSTVEGQFDNLEFRVAADPTFRPRFLVETSIVPPWLQKLIGNCWEHDKDSRPSFDEVIRSLETREAGIDGPTMEQRKPEDDYSLLCGHMEELRKYYHSMMVEKDEEIRLLRRVLQVRRAKKSRAPPIPSRDRSGAPLLPARPRPPPRPKRGIFQKLFRRAPAPPRPSAASRRKAAPLPPATGRHASRSSFGRQAVGAGRFKAAPRPPPGPVFVEEEALEEELVDEEPLDEEPPGPRIRSLARVDRALGGRPPRGPTPPSPPTPSVMTALKLRAAPPSPVASPNIRTFPPVSRTSPAVSPRSPVPAAPRSPPVRQTPPPVTSSPPMPAHRISTARAPRDAAPIRPPPSPSAVANEWKWGPPSLVTEPRAAAQQGTAASQWGFVRQWAAQQTSPAVPARPVPSPPSVTGAFPPRMGASTPPPVEEELLNEEPVPVGPLPSGFANPRPLEAVKNLVHKFERKEPPPPPGSSETSRVTHDRPLVSASSWRKPPAPRPVVRQSPHASSLGGRGLKFSRPRTGVVPPPPREPPPPDDDWTPVRSPRFAGISGSLDRNPSRPQSRPNSIAASSFQRVRAHLPPPTSPVEEEPLEEEPLEASRVFDRRGTSPSEQPSRFGESRPDPPRAAPPPPSEPLRSFQPVVRPPVPQDRRRPPRSSIPSPNIADGSVLLLGSSVETVPPPSEFQRSAPPFRAPGASISFAGRLPPPSREPKSSRASSFGSASSTSLEDDVNRRRPPRRSRE